MDKAGLAAGLGTPRMSLWFAEGRESAPGRRVEGYETQAPMVIGLAPAATVAP